MLWDTGLFHYLAPHSEHPSLAYQRSYGEALAPNHAIDPWDVLQVPKTREMTIQYLKMKARLAGPGPNLLKVHMEHFDYYLLEHSDGELLRELFPDSRFIWLEREDIFARTISAWFSFSSKVPHIKDEKTRQQYFKKAIPFDANGILDVYYNHVKKCNWGPFLEGSEHLKVTYEKLIANPADTLRTCLDWLDTGTTVDCAGIAARQTTIRTERPETREYIKRLKKLLTGMI